MESLTIETFRLNAQKMMEEINKYALAKPNGRLEVPKHIQFILEKAENVIELAEDTITSIEKAMTLEKDSNSLDSKKEMGNCISQRIVLDPQELVLERLEHIDNKMCNLDTAANIMNNQRSLAEKLCVIDDKISNLDTKENTRITESQTNWNADSIGIDKIRNIGGGGVALEIGNKEEAERFHQFIDKEVPQINIRKPKKKLPHMAIYSVPSELTREELTPCIYDQNVSIGDKYSETDFMESFRIKFRMGKRGQLGGSPDLQTHLPIFDRDDLTKTTQAIDSSIDIIINACKKYIPTYINKNKTVPWWNKELSSLRAENIRLRKTYQGCHCEPDRSEHKKNYLEHQRIYKNAMKEAKIQSWKEFCEQAGHNPWGFITRLCTNKLRATQILHSTRVGQNFEEAANNKMDIFCLPDPPEQETDHHHRIRDNITEDINTDNTPEFLAEEIAWTVAKLNNKKAAGHDDISPLLVKNLWALIPEKLIDIYNTCLKYGIFPNSWKHAKIVPVPKPGKEGECRPISLLPTLGKVFERLLTNRLLWHLETNHLLHNNQYGFGPQKSANEAIEKVINSI
ncbi:uncharacterized protein LOC111631272, partial [Centruroides sculpturatus]|uniref:uncharacterized protein LOC111631272 n=1 Tax=Centruroides sculpturatus TaxID=218467 RepID=UPI000C6EDD27